VLINKMDDETKLKQSRSAPSLLANVSKQHGMVLSTPSHRNARRQIDVDRQESISDGRAMSKQMASLYIRKAWSQTDLSKCAISEVLEDVCPSQTRSFWFPKEEPKPRKISEIKLERHSTPSRHIHCEQATKSRDAVRESILTQGDTVLIKRYSRALKDPESGNSLDNFRQNIRQKGKLLRETLAKLLDFLPESRWDYGLKKQQFIKALVSGELSDAKSARDLFDDVILMRKGKGPRRVSLGTLCLALESRSHITSMACLRKRIILQYNSTFEAFRICMEATFGLTMMTQLTQREFVDSMKKMIDCRPEEGNRIWDLISLPSQTDTGETKSLKSLLMHICVISPTLVIEDLRARVLEKFGSLTKLYDLIPREDSIRVNFGTFLKLAETELQLLVGEDFLHRVFTFIDFEKEGYISRNQFLVFVEMAAPDFTLENFRRMVLTRYDALEEIMEKFPDSGQEVTVSFLEFEAIFMRLDFFRYPSDALSLFRRLNYDDNFAISHKYFLQSIKAALCPILLVDSLPDIPIDRFPQLIDENRFHFLVIGELQKAQEGLTADLKLPPVSGVVSLFPSGGAAAGSQKNSSSIGLECGASENIPTTSRVGPSRRRNASSDACMLTSIVNSWMLFQFFDYGNQGAISKSDIAFFVVARNHPYGEHTIRSVKSKQEILSSCRDMVRGAMKPIHTQLERTKKYCRGPLDLKSGKLINGSKNGRDNKAKILWDIVDDLSQAMEILRRENFYYQLQDLMEYRESNNACMKKHALLLMADTPSLNTMESKI